MRLKSRVYLLWWQEGHAVGHIPGEFDQGPRQRFAQAWYVRIACARVYVSALDQNFLQVSLAEVLNDDVHGI